jgi:hypothetical protein
MSLPDPLDKDFAPAWRPAPGDKLVGMITELTERQGTFGKYVIVTVRTDSGEELAVHAFHEVLANELARVAPEIRDPIAIKYLGRHPEKDYHQYRVHGGRRGINWSAYGKPENTSQTELPIETPDLGDPSAGSSSDRETARDDDNDIPFRWDGPVEFADVKYHLNRAVGGGR